jgi:hypothetical protein
MANTIQNGRNPPLNAMPNTMANGKPNKNNTAIWMTPTRPIIEDGIV